MELKPTWYDYATFNADGHVDGIKDDAPQEAKDAYAADKAEEQSYIDRGEMIPR